MPVFVSPDSILHPSSSPISSKQHSPFSTECVQGNFAAIWHQQNSTKKNKKKTDQLPALEEELPF